MSTNVRNANLEGANVENQKLLSATINADDLENIIGYFYFCDAFINNNAAKFRAANEALQKAIKLLEPAGCTQSLGNCYYNRAELALFENDENKFKYALSESRKVFKYLNKPTLLFELDYLEKLNDLINKDSDVDLIPIFDILYQKKIILYGGTMSFLLGHYQSDSVR